MIGLGHLAAFIAPRMKPWTGLTWSAVSIAAPALAAVIILDVPAIEIAGFVAVAIACIFVAVVTRMITGGTDPYHSMIGGATVGGIIVCACVFVLGATATLPGIVSALGIVAAAIASTF
jgi:hypothetical protein